MIYLLLIILVIIFIVQLIWFKDLFQPALLICASYIISVTSAAFNDNRWNIELTGKTLLIICLTVVIFWLIDYVCTISSKKRRLENADINQEIIKIEKWKVKLVIFYDIVVILLYILEVRRIASLAGWSGGIDSLMSTYRSISYSSASMGDNVNIIVSQLVKLTSVFRMIFLYVYINNSVLEKTFKRYLNYLIPVGLSIIQTLFAAQRMALIMTMIFGLFVWYSSYHKLFGWHKNMNIKLFKKSFKYMIILFILFFILKEFVGRTTTLDFFGYITSYTGGSINLFNQYLNSTPIDKMVGQETFASIYTFLAKFGFVENSVRHLEFRLYDTTGFYREVGNVYTALRRYYNDFGYWGVVILNSIMAFCYSYWFNRIKTVKKKRDSKNLQVIIYGYIMYALIMHAIDDIFFSEILSIGFLVQLLLLKVAYVFLVNIKFRRT